MNLEERERIQQSGAEARARGKSMFDNPYLQPDLMPARTSETLEVWQEKMLAWEYGWRVEDLQRSNS